MARTFENCSECPRFLRNYIKPQEKIVDIYRSGAQRTAEYGMQAGENPLFVGDSDYARSMKAFAERKFAEADDLEVLIGLETQLGADYCEGPEQLNIGKFTVKSYCSTSLIGRNLARWGLTQRTQSEE